MPLPRLTAGGRGIEAAHRTVRQALGGLEIVIDPAEAGRGPIVVADAPSDAILKARITREVALEKASAITGGWGLQRDYFRLNGKSGALTPLEGRVAIGDLVYVRLSFRPRAGTLPWWSSSYYALTDTIPAGFSVVAEDKVYDAAPFRLGLHAAGQASRDIRDDRIRWTFAFARRWMDRAYQTGYVMRARYAGEFAAGVARLEDFYDESLFSQTASRRLGVDPLPDRPRR